MLDNKNGWNIFNDGQVFILSALGFSGYTRRYRYCDYLGKYFCPCCHSNDVAYIPSRILRRWDFSKYCVSNFARDFLKRIYKDPLFNVMDINEGLYRKVRLLEATADCRRQLCHLRAFLKTCRLGSRQHECLEKLPAHWMNDIHLYSIAELVEVNTTVLIMGGCVFVLMLKLK